MMALVDDLTTLPSLDGDLDLIPMAPLLVIKCIAPLRHRDVVTHDLTD